MSPPSSSKAERIYQTFTEARHLSRPEQSRLLDQLDTETRQEVEGLLAMLERRQMPPALGLSERFRSLTLSIDAKRIPKQIGFYRLEERIGEGTTGVVFSATHQRIQKQVAIKLLHAEDFDRRSLTRFQTEIETLSKTRHPYLVEIYSSGTWDSGSEVHPYFAMEKIDGMRLDQWVEQNPSLSDRLTLFIGIADGVHHMHQKLVLHRDLKPSNVMVDSLGRPRVLDFSVAKDLSTEVEAELTRPGDIIGSFESMSPEQASGKDELDVRSDVYGLSTLLYLLLTERMPLEYRGMSYLEALGHLATEEPIRPRRLDPKIPRELEHIVLKGLSKEREQRYQEARALRMDVQRFLNHEPIEAQAPSSLYRLRKWVRRNRARAALGGISLVAAIGFLVGWLVMQQQLFREQETQSTQLEFFLSALDWKRGDQLDCSRLIESLGEKPKVLAETADRLVAEADRNRIFSHKRYLDRGEAFLDAACELYRAAIPGAPTIELARSWRRELATAMVKRADRDVHVNQHGVAFPIFMEVHEVFLQLVEEMPGDRRALDDLGWSYDRISYSLMKQSELAEKEGKVGLAASLKMSATEMKKEQLEVALEETRRHALSYQAWVLLSGTRLTQIWPEIDSDDEKIEQMQKKAECAQWAHEAAGKAIKLAPLERATNIAMLRAPNPLWRDAEVAGDVVLAHEYATDAMTSAAFLARDSLGEESIEAFEIEYACGVYTNYGRWLLDLGNEPGAERALRKAIDLLEDWSKRPSVDLRQRDRRAHRLNALLDQALMKQGKPLN